MTKRSVFSLFLIALALGVANAAAPIPQACQTECISPYGKVLGEDKSKVVAYSNCNAGCVVFEPNRQEGTYTGIKWQCVEYARRWLLSNQGVVFGDVDIAADIWKLSEVSRVPGDTKQAFHSYVNGSSSAPQVGDLLIYNSDYLKTGHVAVVTKVDSEQGKIYVAEQNFLNQAWPADYARSIKLLKDGEQYWLHDPYLIGWKRVAHE